MPMNDPLLEALAAELGSLLAARGWRVTAAESCTGGLVAGAITATAGSSGWFDQAFVTYSNAAKARQLDVPEALLAAHGAVSEPVARAMASASLERAGADLSVAVTGIAGPGGGSPDKPVGTVCFAWAQREAPVVSTTHRFDGDRAAVRHASVVAALEGLIERVRVGATAR
jgi:nicotinamide-nucleotide amidase